MYHGVECPTSIPNKGLTKYKDKSIPAATPAEVEIYSSKSNRTSFDMSFGC